VSWQREKNMSEVEDGVPAWIYSSKMEDMTLVLTY